MWHPLSYPQLPAQLGLGSERSGARPLISGLAVVLAHEEVGARHHWKLMFSTLPSPSGLEYEMQRLWTFRFATPTPSGKLPVPVPPLPNS